MSGPAQLPFLPVAGATEATTFDCPLCGGRFSHGLQVCGACPLNAGCALVRCPNCGYQFPRTSSLVEWGRRLARRFAERRR
jgi:hypothetical protein